VACDGCAGWFHPACVGFDDADVGALDGFLCPACAPRAARKRRRRR
jgi:hypothetical protein